MFRAALGYAIYWLRRGLSVIESAFKIVSKFVGIPLDDAGQIAGIGQRAIERGSGIGFDLENTLLENEPDILSDYESRAKIIIFKPGTGEYIGGYTIEIKPWQSFEQALQEWLAKKRASTTDAEWYRNQLIQSIKSRSFVIDFIDIGTAANADLISRVG